MSCTGNRLRHFTLELQARARQSSWEDLTLLVHELQQEVAILVIDVLDTALLETAVLLTILLFVYSFVN